MLETLISHQIVQLTNVCIVAKGKVLLLIFYAKSKLSSSGHRLLQFCQWTLNSGAGVGTDKIRGLNRLLSSWVHHWLVRCVPISWSGGQQKPDAVSFPSWPCFCSSGHVLFRKRFSSWCYWKWSLNGACCGDARSTQFCTAAPWCQPLRALGSPSGDLINETESSLQDENRLLMLDLCVRCCLNVSSFSQK